jgi:hypothetical protein
VVIPDPDTSTFVTEGETFVRNEVWQPDTKRVLFGDQASGALSPYQWVEIDEVRRVAEGLGFAFRFERLTRPVELAIYQPLELRVVASEPATGGRTDPVRGQAEWRFPSVAADAGWCLPVDQLHPPRVIRREPVTIDPATTFWGPALNETQYYYELTRAEDSLIERTRRDYLELSRPGESFLWATATALLWQSFLSAGQTSRGWLLTSPQPWIDWQGTRLGSANLPDWILAIQPQSIVRLARQPEGSASWSPLTAGRLLDNAALEEIAGAGGFTHPQAWHLYVLQRAGVWSD